MAVVADAGEPLSPQAADLIRQIARVFLDEPADLMAGVHAAVLAAADEPLRSEPVLAAEVAASNRANVLHLAASMLRDLYTHRNTVLNRLQRAERLLPLPLAGHGLEIGVALEITQWLGTQPGSATHDR